MTTTSNHNGSAGATARPGTCHARVRFSRPGVAPGATATIATPDPQ